MSIEEFLTPRLCGTRFNNGAIPLEVLRDLAVLEEMVIEVAKWRFLEVNSARKRCPRGFEDVELRLIRVDDGSARPVLAVVLGSLTLPGLHPNLQYHEQAREAIVSAIEAAEQNLDPTDYLPTQALSYFDRLGRSLRPGETIEFTTALHPAIARLDKETRRRLVLAPSSVLELTDEITLRGSIPEADQDNMSFQIQLFDGRKMRAPLNRQHRDIVLETFTHYLEGARVLIRGIGRFDRQDRLLSVQSIEHITPLDPLDVAARVDELRSLRDGWLDRQGRAPSKSGLDWLTSMFDQRFQDDLALPHLYPTPEGGVQAEWSFHPHDIGLNIDLDTHRGEWYRLNLETDEDETHILDLNDDAAWDWLANSLRELAVGAA